MVYREYTHTLSKTLRDIGIIGDHMPNLKKSIVIVRLSYICLEVIEHGLRPYEVDSLIDKFIKDIQKGDYNAT